MNNSCVLYERPCIDCGECDKCDMDSNRICNSCGRCIDDNNEFRSLDVMKFFEKQTDSVTKTSDKIVKTKHNKDEI